MKSVNQRFDSDFLRSVANFIAILAAFAMNVYANVAPPNGLTIGEISNRFFREVPIIPANYAFAIWGVIYLGLISFAVYQVLPAQRQNPYLRREGYFLVFASIAQIAWVFLFGYQLFSLSVVAMLFILLSLIGIYLRLGIGLERVSRAQKWFVHIPLSIYLAWISVATIVNVASTLDYLGWNGWGISPQIWTVILLVVAAAIAATITLKRADIAYPSVIIWAFVAIAVRQASQPLIAVTAVGFAIALGLLILWRQLRRPKVAI
ncbi:tryptophan-rich sensory protein [Trichocoleus sp. DQ-U1]|uniref:tryptophan-rich sensory protein n=1 Tax=Trichocoleus sp. DQ-U1 TaxID=2933926 RepID=UPI003297F14F